MSRIERAVLVAAGRSTRLRPLTLDTPKCLLDVGGAPMIVRSVRALRDAGVGEIAVVVGFEHEKVRATVGDDGVDYLLNPLYAECNNLGSLWFARAWVGDDPFLYLHADLVYDPALLEPMVEEPTGDAALLVDEGPVDDEAMKVRIGGGVLVESNKDIPLDEADGEWTGIAAVSAGAVTPLFDTLEEVLLDGLNQAYDTEAFTRMAQRGHRFGIVPTGDAPWSEVDFLEDLDRARELFGS